MVDIIQILFKVKGALGSGIVEAAVYKKRPKRLGGVENVSLSFLA